MSRWNSIRGQSLGLNSTTITLRQMTTKIRSHRENQTMMMRRLTRYSIRSLLVLVTVACVVLGWYVSNRRAHEREMAVLDRLQQGWRMGFWRGEEGESPPGWGFDLNTAHLARPGPP